MSRNFELMQRVGRGFAVPSIPQQTRKSPGPSIPQPIRMSSELHEKAHQNGTRLNLGQVAREEASRLVQRIFLSSDPQAPRAVLFAGIDQGVGCSQICLLVAETLRGAVSGSICLVEANLRSPSLPGMLGTTNHHGLTDAMVEGGAIRSFARPLEIDNVWFLSCGSLSSDSPNFLNSDRLKACFEELRAEFDYLLVDAPSLSRYGDATALGRLTDGLVLVLEANSTRKEAALMVMESLRAAQIKVLGAVLNKRTFPIPESLYRRL
jgi:Mrp family chromosome partitioning ATPase